MKVANAPRKANAWIDEHVQEDTTWYGDALVVEHRYAWPCGWHE